MKLYIGGYKQGKLAYVRKQNPGKEQKIRNDFHLWVRQLLLDGRDAEAEVDAYLKEHPDAIVICDEIGNGIVPMEAFERDYRERLGRILIHLAEQAECVERVFCGLGQRIK